MSCPKPPWREACGAFAPRLGGSGDGSKRRGWRGVLGACSWRRRWPRAPISICARRRNSDRVGPPRRTSRQSLVCCARGETREGRIRPYHYARPASTPWHGSRKRGRLARADPLGRRTRRGRITLCSRSSRRCRRSSASRSSRKICQRRDHPRVPSGMRTSWTSWFSSSHRRSSNGGGTEQAHCQCRPLCPSRLGHRRRGRGLSRCSPPVALLPLLAVPYPGPAARQRAQLRWRRFFHGSPSSRRW